MRGFPGGEALVEFRIGNIDGERALGQVEDNGVAVTNGGNRSSHRGLRGHVTGHEAMRGA